MDRILDAARNPTPRNTLVVEGVAGAGKTALLRDAARLFERGGTGKAVFFPEPWTAGSEGNALQGMASTAFGSGVDVFADAGPGASPRWSGFAGRYGHRTAQSRPLLVLVDEAHGFAADASDLLRKLHAQSEVPFTLVCAGSRVASAAPCRYLVKADNVHSSAANPSAFGG